MEQVLQSFNSAGIEQEGKGAAEEIGVVWHGESEIATSHDGGGDDDGYHESDWDSEVDKHDMFETFRKTDDWTSRLDLIIKKAMST